MFAFLLFSQIVSNGLPLFQLGSIQFSALVDFQGYLFLFPNVNRLEKGGNEAAGSKGF